MTPDPDTLAKQREQLAKRRALRASIPEEAALEAAAAAPRPLGSPANSSRGSSEGAAIAEAAAAMAAGDPTHPATLFASFSARDAGERAASSRADDLLTRVPAAFCGAPFLRARTPRGATPAAPARVLALPLNRRRVRLRSSRPPRSRFSLGRSLAPRRAPSR